MPWHNLSKEERSFLERQSLTQTVQSPKLRLEIKENNVQDKWSEGEWKFIYWSDCRCFAIINTPVAPCKFLCNFRMSAVITRISLALRYAQPRYTLSLGQRLAVEWQLSHKFRPYHENTTNDQSRPTFIR